MNKRIYLICLCVCLLMIPETSRSEWSKVRRPGGEVLSLASSGNTLFGVGFRGRLLSTMNAGDSWIDPRGSHQYDFYRSTFYSLAFFPEVSLLGASGGRIVVGNPGSAPTQSLVTVGTDDIHGFAESRGKFGVRFLAGGFGGGVRVSNDSGVTWAASNTGLMNLNVTSLASGLPLPDSSGEALFAGTYGDGVFASTDNGQSWFSRGETISSFQVTALTVAHSGLYVAGSGGKVFRSSDWGTSWQEVGPGLPYTELLCVNSVEDGLQEWVYCGTLDAGVWRCPASGGTWTPMNTGLGNLRVNAIELNGGGLYAGTHEGVYRSYDFGLSWTFIGEDWIRQPTVIHAMPAPGPVGKDVLLAGAFGRASTLNSFSTTFSTTDAGNNWDTTAALFTGHVVSIAHHDELLLLLSYGTIDMGPLGGLHVSSDMGVTWENRMGGFTFPMLFSCMSTVSRKDDSGLDCYVATNGGPTTGVFFSSDTGHSWEGIRGRGASSIGAIDSFLVIRTGDSTLRTTDRGVTWDDITSNAQGNEVLSFVNDGERLLACMKYDPAKLRPGGVWMTTDVGSTWLPAGLEGRTVTSLVPVGDHILVVADGKIYATRRDVFEWVDVTEDLFGTTVGMITATSQYCYAMGLNGRSIWKRPMTEILQAFTVVPAAPALLVPPIGATDQPVSVRIQWTRPAFASSFKLQCSEDSTFSRTFVRDTSIVDTALVVSALENSRSYYWRVRGINENGFGEWSPIGRFSTIVAIPARARLVSPGNGQSSIGVGLLLRWHRIEYADRYHIQMAEDSSFTMSFVLNDSSRTDTSMSFTGLKYGLSYFWRVRAVNQAGSGQWSSTWRFATMDSIPGSVALVSPVDGDVNLSVSPALRWRRVPNVLSYHLQLSHDTTTIAGFVVNDSTLVDSTKQTLGLTNGTPYVWRARARTSSGWGPWSSYWSFKTIVALPELTVLMSPQQRASIGADSVRAVWKGGAPEILRYWIEYSTDSLFMFRLVDSTLTDTTYVMRHLLTGREYWWRVKAVNVAGWGQFSEAHSFTVNMTGLGRGDLIPQEFVLFQNHPNPFNPTTTIRYGLPSRAHVSLTLFNTLGQQVSTLVQSEQDAGFHEIRFDGTNLPSGVYFYRMQAGSFTETRRLLLVR